MKEKTPKMIRQRKLLLVLPLLTLPFVTLMFWALKGETKAIDETKSAKLAGFNINLPDAKVKENKQMDKMAYYNQAALDSAKYLEMVKNDPNYSGMMDAKSPLPGDPNSENSAGLNTSLNGYGRGHNDPNSENIYRKLAELNREIDRPTNTSSDGGNPGYSRTSAPVNNTAEVDRLEQMMQMMGGPAGEDPEMTQLNGMLEKIIDIQNPALAQEKLRKISEAKRGQVFSVNQKDREEKVSLLENGTAGLATNGFYALIDNRVTNEIQNAIQAVVHETQTIVNGSTIKLRLLNDVYINGVRIPKDNFLFGAATLNGERLEIKINSIRYNNSLFPVELLVFDMDGLDGIYIPGAISRDVAKESADRTLQNVDMPMLDPSWGAQAASAGIEAAKSLFSKKVKLVKVTVKAGYRVLLRDEKQKQGI